MKKLMIICIYFFSYIFSTKAAELKLIKDATIETDYVLDGVQGILISYTFVESENDAYNDSINDLLFDRTFMINVHLFENNKAIKPIEDYEGLAAIDGSIEFSSQIDRFYPRDLPEPTFIPYATLNLAVGKHIISAKLDVYSHEFSNAKYKKQHQKLELKNISFVKPKTQKMYVHFDAIELNPNIEINVYNYENDANAMVAIYLADVYAYSNSFKDKFSTISRENSISFTISKNDIVGLSVYKYGDNSETFLPIVYFNTEELVPNKWAEYNKKNTKLSKCRIFYKVE